MVTIHPGFPDTVLTLLSILIPITQCILISYLENTIILVSCEKEDIHHLSSQSPTLIPSRLTLAYALH